MMSVKKSGVSRRDMFKAMGTGALGMSLLQMSPARVSAQDDMTIGLPQAAKYYGFTVGDFQMMVISDASAALPAPIMGANMEESDVIAFMESRKLLAEDGTIPNIVDILVANTGDDLILFDTGLGASDQLHSTLAAAGIHPEDVTKVIISHQHGDHVGGLSSEAGLTYPNAQVFFPQPEFDVLAADSRALMKLQPAIDADRVTFYNDGDSLVTGITAMAAHGHTPGHMAFMIESNGSVLMNAVDSAINVYSGSLHPDWHVRFDSIPDMAVENRKRIFAMSSDDNIRLFGYHFPYPGIGYMVRIGDGDEWIWTPTSY
jgi:glyoxylase-like metal-dependent hydrolase (beta-lactamase superfamily II)